MKPARTVRVPLAIAVLSASFLLLAAPRAGAVTGITSGGSIIHTKAGDVWLISPDGTVQQRLTSDGNTPTADNTGSDVYQAPSQSDDGNVVVAVRNQLLYPGYEQGYIWVLNRQGQVVRKFAPPQFILSGSSPCLVPKQFIPQGILQAAVSPDGTRIAYESLAIYQFGLCEQVYVHDVYVVNVDGTNPVQITRSDGNGAALQGTNWASASRLLVDSASSEDTLYYADLPATAKTWFADPAPFDAGVEYPSLKSGKLATVGYSGAAMANVLRLWSSAGPPTAPTQRCEYSATAGGSSSFAGSPSVAPDGGAVTWDESVDRPDQAGEGIYVMAVGDLAAGCPAASARQLLVQGGSWPFWGPSAVKATNLSINDVTVTEGNSGTTAATFTVTRTGDVTGPSTVAYATADGTATAGADYTAVPATTVTFVAGQTSKTVTVNVIGDTADEPRETFSVNLSSPTGATISDATGVATVVDDDAPTYLSVSDVSVTEGNAGTTPATFTVTRSGNTAVGVSVKYATANASATAGSDYTALASTTLSFAAGETSKTVAADVTGDTAAEANETFNLNLSSPVGATISDATGVATVENDD